VKKAVAIFLFFSLFIQVVAQLGVVGFYEINKDFIAKNLCENRNQPFSKCCGKCYLKKQLNKLDRSENSKNGKTLKVEKTEIVFLTSPIIYFPQPIRTFSEKVFNPFEKRLSVQLFPQSIFHPPSVFC
jgi:hypothetical protein